MEEGFTPPGYCPNCGEYVEKGALACDHCGSCPDTAWSDASYDGLDLPEGYGSYRTSGEGRELLDEKGKATSGESSMLGRFVVLGIVALIALYLLFGR